MTHAVFLYADRLEETLYPLDDSTRNWGEFDAGYLFGGDDEQCALMRDWTDGKWNVANVGVKMKKARDIGKAMTACRDWMLKNTDAELITYHMPDSAPLPGCADMIRAAAVDEKLICLTADVIQLYAVLWKYAFKCVTFRRGAPPVFDAAGQPTKREATYIPAAGKFHITGYVSYENYRQKMRYQNMPGFWPDGWKTEFLNKAANCWQEAVFQAYGKMLPHVAGPLLALDAGEWTWFLERHQLWTEYGECRRIIAEVNRVNNR